MSKFKNIDDLGLVFLNESVSDDTQMTNVVVHNDNGVFFVEFECCYHSFDVMNRNMRMYDKSNILEKIRTDERIQTYLKNGGWFGEMNHPMSEYTNMELSPERIRDIKMDNTSHKALRVWDKGNLLMAQIQTDSGTSAGMNLARKIVQGFNPAFSCRSIAKLNMVNGKPIVDVKKIITYDWVLFQSHREAEKDIHTPFIFRNAIPKVVNEGVAAIKEKVNDKVMVPLKDILRNIGEKNVNAQIIMESFDLSYDDIIGVTEDQEKIIIKNEMNTIYCNTTPNDRRKLSDFLSSMK